MSGEPEQLPPAAPSAAQESLDQLGAAAAGLDAPTAPQGEAAAAPGAAMPPPAPPAAPAIPVDQVLAKMLFMLFSTVAPAWQVQEHECEMLGGAYADVLNKYFPNLELGVELTAVAATLIVFGPRRGKPMRIQKADAGAGASPAA